MCIRDRGKGLAARVRFVAARIVEVLVGIALMRKLCPHFLVGEAIGRRLEAVVLELHIARTHCLPVVELTDVGALLEGCLLYTSIAKIGEHNHPHYNKNPAIG